MRLPLHNLEIIVCFNYLGASPALMGACAERNIGLCFLTPNGRFLARVSGKVKGNVLLRKKQYPGLGKRSEKAFRSHVFLIGQNRQLPQSDRAGRPRPRHAGGCQAFERGSRSLQEIVESDYQTVPAIDDLMGFEGSAAKIYFGVFDQLILQQNEAFFFKERSRRPPLDNMNSLLSFLYTLLTNEVASALEAVGLDPYVGFLHQDRPGGLAGTGFDGGAAPSFCRPFGAFAG